MAVQVFNKDDVPAGPGSNDGLGKVGTIIVCVAEQPLIVPTQKNASK